jgi:hypothetical protein
MLPCLDGNLEVTVLEHSVRLQRLQPEVLLFRQAATIGAEIKTGGLLITAGGANNRYRFGWSPLGMLRCLDGDLDVSGTGTFSEAVTTTSEVLLFRQVQPMIGAEIKTGGLLDYCWRCYNNRYRFGGHRWDVTFDGDLDVSGTGTSVVSRCNDYNWRSCCFGRCSQ